MHYRYVPPPFPLPISPYPLLPHTRSFNFFSFFLSTHFPLIYKKILSNLTENLSLILPSYLLMKKSVDNKNYKLLTKLTIKYITNGNICQ